MTTNKQSILIVDDQPTNIQALIQILKDQFAIQAAKDGHKALELARSIPQPDLILLDVMMPVKDGFTVCAELKSDPATQHIPIIFITSKNETIDEAKGLRLGAVDYLTKPVNPELVLARIHNHLELASYRKNLEIKVKEKTLALVELNEEIENTLQDTLFTVGEIVEQRSMETGFHVKRVSEYAYHLALQYGMEGSECDRLRLASYLHDIGKTAIPDQILNKPGKYEPHEFEQMKKHTEFGYNILKNSPRPIFQVAATVAYTHHEKWDGSGYPNQLKGEDIPIYGRIAALADVFDALGSERCYKKSWKLDDILSFLKEQSGKHFDPVLINHFFHNLDLYLSIRDQYSETQECA